MINGAGSAGFDKVDWTCRRNQFLNDCSVISASTFRPLFFQPDVFTKISSNCGYKIRGLIQQRFHLILAQFKIFPIIAFLPKFEGVVEGTAHSFRKETAFYKTFVEISQYAAVFGRCVGLIDQKSQDGIKHSVIKTIGYGTEAFAASEQILSFLKALCRLMQSVQGKELLLLIRTHIVTPSRWMIL